MNVEWVGTTVNTQNIAVSFGIAPSGVAKRQSSSFNIINSPFVITQGSNIWILINIESSVSITDISCTLSPPPNLLVQNPTATLNFLEASTVLVCKAW